tara:strand:+ start:7365 stop:7916 length:552 start_codon:yes stop_codon:yes gene_type:complete
MTRFIPRLLTLALAATLTAGAAQADVSVTRRALLDGAARVTVINTRAPARALPVHAPHSDARARVARLMERMLPRALPARRVPDALMPGHPVPRHARPSHPHPRIQPFSRRGVGHDPLGHAVPGRGRAGFDLPGHGLRRYSGAFDLGFGAALRSSGSAYFGPGWRLNSAGVAPGGLTYRIAAD